MYDRVDALREVGAGSRLTHITDENGIGIYYSLIGAPESMGNT